MQQLVSAFIGFILTVMVLSYLIGDNPLFRVAVSIFVGAAAGYAVSVTVYQVIWPNLIVPLASASMLERGLLLIPLLLGLLLFTRISPQLARLSSPAMGYLTGVAAAVAVGGAVIGTLAPQIAAAATPFDMTDAAARGSSPLGQVAVGIVMLTATITTLVYFNFGARRAADGTVRRNGLLELAARVGQIFIAITFGVLFAGVYAAALTALIERVHALLDLFGLF
jgi:hypothetical protein